jgi:prophage antirepressor-like protein
MNELANVAKFYLMQENWDVRIFDRDGNYWFVARDACAILEIRQSGHIFDGFPDSEKGWYTIPTLGGSQKMRIVNEAGLYRLIFKSRKPEAKRFQTWVFEEVLPSIRKNGFYKASLPKTWSYRGQNLPWGEYIAKEEAAFMKRNPDADFDDFLKSLPNR